MIPGTTSRRVQGSGLRLHVVEAGRGPTVVLLHGFPDFWYGWRLQLPALASAGFHVVAVDLPGYNESDRPRAVRAYALPELMAEVAGLIESVSTEPVVLVGHDWGGVLAWRLAARHPELVRRLVILNAPHPAVFARLLRTSSQLRKSWYAFFFQLPWLPEWLLGRRDFALLERLWRTGVRRGSAVTDDDVRLYKRAMAGRGALRAALAYYRAVPRGLVRRLARRIVRRAGGRVGLRGSGGRGRSVHIEVPTMVIWGERDRHLDVRNLEGLERWVPDLVVERVPDAGHWVQLDAPDRVNELLIRFSG